jgi:bifunctional UDP-N-acetylglucosamine pyrophosphorylase / glucosamine-1-phosphate N-acetyltransferase
VTNDRVKNKPIEICAVVPAAGRGTRLGGGSPKILAQLGNGETIWSYLSRNLIAVAGHVNVIVSPDGEPAIREAIESAKMAGQVSLSIQSAPTGMGDAIFCGYPVWSRADVILIVWGDQVFVSRETLSRTCALHGGNARTVVLPVVRLPQPYVEYVFGHAGRLESVRQSREGDACAPNGYGDLGTFALSVAGLRKAWTKYLTQVELGSATGETNFLPFLPYLAAAGWTVERLDVADPREARGINTPDDLEFFRQTLEREPKLTGKGRV